METIKIKILYPGTLHTFFKKDDTTILCGNILLSEEEPAELQIEGQINSSDIIFLRNLCGGGTDFRRRRELGYIKVLNLNDVTFGNDNTPYFTTRSDFGVATHGIRPKTITSYMFALLKGVEKIILPADIKKIERDAFYDCSAKEVVIPECTETLETNSFERSHIESININAITLKNKSLNCCHLKSITFGKNVKHINGAFSFHPLLESVELSPDNKNFRIVNGCVLNARKTHLVLYVQQENVVQLIIPEGIERICGAAFQGKQVLKDIVLPNSLQYIGSRAFCCTSIEEINIPSNVTIINGRFLPRTIKSIYFHSPTPPNIKGEYMFLPQILANDDFIIFIPKGCMESYLEKLERYKKFVREADYGPQDRTPKKEVKNRAFYQKLAKEIRDMCPMEIAHHYDIFPQGRFTGKQFINVWESNLYYIKWMIRLGTIKNITDEVFNYLLVNYPMKRPAINNLKELLTMSQKKRARIVEEEKLLKEEELKFIAEQEQYRLEQDSIKEDNRQFEEMINDYEAWGNLD